MTSMLRRFRKQAYFTLVSIVGLGVGLAGFILVVLFVDGETSYDSWLPDSGRIVRIGSTLNLPGRDPLLSAETSPSLAILLEGDPRIKGMARAERAEVAFLVGATPWLEPIAWVDPGFLSVLGFPLAKGDAGTALARPDGIVVSPVLAAKLFGSADPMGRTVEVKGVGMFTVTGVLATRGPSHLRFEALAPDAARGRHAFANRRDQDWAQGGALTYAKLAPGVARTDLAAALPNLVERFGVGLPDREEYPNFLTLRVDPVADIHLFIPTLEEHGGAGDPAMLVTLSAVAALILAVAVFNYVNLSTALAIHRAREVGLRKLAGARRLDLALVFIGESVVVAFIGLGLGLALVECLAPWAEMLTRARLSLSAFSGPVAIAAVATAPLVLGIAGGAYPAFILSRLTPAEALRSRPSIPQSHRLREGLVALQFAVAIGLAIGTITIARQTEFLRTYDLGFDSSGLILAGRLPHDPSRLRVLETELLRSPAVAGVVFSNLVPADQSESISSIQRMDVAGPAEPPVVTDLVVAPGFAETYRAEFLAGQGPPAGWHPLPRTDPATRQPVQAGSRYVLLTETAAKRLGFAHPTDAVGQLLVVGPDGQRHPSEVSGVIRDLRFRTARNEAEAMVVQFSDAGEWVTVKAVPGRRSEAALHLDETLRALFPELDALRQHHAEERLHALYDREDRQVAMLAGAGSAAIVLALAGLLGMASLSAARRTKEIGIRRVLGAPVHRIVMLLVVQFLRPALVANLVAWPVCWYFLSEWLAQFSVRVGMPLWPILSSSAGVVLIAFAAVGGHAVRVASRSPINALRTE